MPRPPRRTEKILNVYNWSDYIQPDGHQGLREGVRHPGQLRRLRLQRGAGDQAPYRAHQLRRRRALGSLPASGRCRPDIYRKLDKSLLPNLKNVDPEHRASALAVYDPGNQYGVDYMWITSGVGLQRGAASAQRMPDAPVDSWRMIFDPAVVSQFADCGVSILDAPSEVVATVLLYLGSEPEQQFPRRPEGGRAAYCRPSGPTSATSTPRATSTTWPMATSAWRWAGRGRQAGARPRRRGRQGRGAGLLASPSEGAISQLRHAGDPGRRAAS